MYFIWFLLMSFLFPLFLLIFHSDSPGFLCYPKTHFLRFSTLYIAVKELTHDFQVRKSLKKILFYYHRTRLFPRFFFIFIFSRLAHFLIQNSAFSFGYSNFPYKFAYVIFTKITPQIAQTLIKTESTF